jgi:hypothetical protein
VVDRNTEEKEIEVDATFFTSEYPNKKVYPDNSNPDSEALDGNEYDPRLDAHVD